MKIRYLLTGRPAIVVNPSGIDYKELKSLNMTLDDLIEAMRGCEVYNIEDIAYAIIEKIADIISSNITRGHRFSQIEIVINNPDEYLSALKKANVIADVEERKATISKLAQEKHFGGMACYRASEGKVVQVEYKGPADAVMQEILGGIRSTMSYIGARRLKDIAKCTTFYRVNRQLNEVFGKS